LAFALDEGWESVVSEGELARGRRSRWTAGLNKGGSMGQLWTGIGAALAALGVMLGAFGAHALKARIPAEMLAIFETGNRYHMYHALGLILVGLVASRSPSTPTNIAGGALTAGILLFSGSLYALSISGVRWLGAITPLGGLAFILGWSALAWGALRG
jgi:uncharacterized membrane protein YgdD (TMEM256/DUF423 family)